MAFAKLTKATDPSRLDRLVWTAHAAVRRHERGLDRAEVENVIRTEHRNRAINQGRAQWRVTGNSDSGVRVVAVYDHPHGADPRAARIVSVWES